MRESRIGCDYFSGGIVADSRGPAPGVARLHLADGVPLLRPEEQVFSAMLDGWRNQQLARNLAFSTVEGRERVVRAFAVHADAFPWQWTPLLVDEWCTDLRAVRGLRRSTLRQYQESVRMLCEYLTDPEYGWAGQCIARFGTHPVQVCHEWNTAVHAQQAEGDPVKRAFTQDELQAFFDHADDRVARVRASGRKGWLAAFRDAVLFKIAYAYGLRRREVRMLDIADFGRNPKAPEFGDYGVCYVPTQGEQRIPAQTAQRADGLGVGTGDPRPVGQRGPAADGGRRQPGAVAVGASTASRAAADRLPVRGLPGRARP